MNLSYMLSALTHAVTWSCCMKPCYMFPHYQVLYCMVKCNVKLSYMLHGGVLSGDMLHQIMLHSLKHEREQFCVLLCQHEIMLHAT